MPVTKFFSRETVRDPERVPYPQSVDLFTEILDKRLLPELIDPAVKSALVLSSGGVVRELIRIIDRCCDRCKLHLSRRIREGQFEQPMTRIDQAILSEVWVNLQIEYSRPLGTDDYELLKSIYVDFQVKNTEDQRFLDLLHSLYILEYENSKLWYDLSPVVIEMMREQGEL